MKDIDELDALHAAATAGEWRVEHDRVDQPNIHAEHGEWVALLPHQCLISLEVMANANAASIAALHNAWPSVSARLRAVAEAAREYRAMEAPGLDMCRDNARDVLDAALAALEAP